MKNQHVAAVIDAYLEADKLPVPHAILISGPWGSGKTYFLEKEYELRRQEAARANRVYKTPLLFVSLFGARTALDVEKRIHFAANPGEFLTGKAFGTFLLGAGEVIQAKDATTKVLNFMGRKAAQRYVDYILVFDDLERVEVGSLGEIMGFVNSLVTTGGRRVILVGDEEKLLKIHCETNWNEQNEKIVGRRVRIDPNIESVVRCSVADVPDDGARAFMTEHIDALIDTARRSNVANLRNLSWAIVNGAKFTRILLSDTEIPKEHVKRTMLIVVATTLWFRSNKLDESSIEKIPNLSRTLMVRSIGERDKTNLTDDSIVDAQKFAETFADLSVESPPLEYSRIIEFENAGIIDESAFISWTKSQFGFGEGRSEPAWRRLWHHHARPMADTEKAIEDLARELLDCVHTTRGEILHCVGLAIKLKQANDDRLTQGQNIVEFFKNYIDNLTINDSLSGGSASKSYALFDSYQGLGFAAVDTAEFREIRKYLIDRQEEVDQAALLKRAEEIIQSAEAGDLDALHKLNMMNDELSRNPVLIAIDVGRMAAVLTSDVDALDAGARLLAYRYHDRRSGEPLMAEISWARAVYQAMLQKIEEWPEPHRSMSKRTLEGLIRHYEQGRPPEERIIPSEAESDVRQAEERDGD